MRKWWHPFSKSYPISVRREWGNFHPICLLQYENQAFVLGKWGTTGLVGRHKFSDVTGKVKLKQERFLPPRGWEWEGDWFVDPARWYVLNPHNNIPPSAVVVSDWNTCQENNHRKWEGIQPQIMFWFEEVNIPWKSPCELLTFSIQGKYKQSNLPTSYWSEHLCSSYPVSCPYSFVSNLSVTGTTVLWCVPQPVDWSGHRPHRVHRWGFSKWNTISWWRLEACCRAVYRCGKWATHAQVHVCTDMHTFLKTLDKNVEDKTTKMLMIREKKPV